jgi:hypothetical protein
VDAPFYPHQVVELPKIELNVTHFVAQRLCFWIVYRRRGEEKLVIENPAFKARR